MKLEKFKEILNEEFVACFKLQIGREAANFQFSERVKHADDFAAITNEIDIVYGLQNMSEVWEAVKKAQKVSEAVKCVVKKHKKVSASEPSGTYAYQYDCIVAERLMNVLQRSITAEVFNTNVLSEVQKYIDNHSAIAKANPSPYLFGTLKPKQTSTHNLFAGTVPEKKENTATTAATKKVSTRFTFGY